MKKSLFCIVAILFFVTGLNASSSKIADYTYKIEMELIPARPKIGQVINVKWKVSGDKSATNAYASINTFGAPAEIVEIVSPLKGNGTVDNENKGIKFSITKGEVKTFEASIIIHSAPHALLYNKAKSVGFSLGVLSYDKINGKGIGVCADPRKQLYLIDKATGQLGTLSDWDEMVNGPLKLRKIFWKYNHIDGEWLNVPDQSFEITNRQIAANMKTLEPALTDSEALCLHADNIKLIVNAVGDPKATDDERIKILLSKGWLKAQREGSSVKEKWFINFIKSNNGKWDRSSTDPQFFRDDVNNGAIVCNSSGGDGSKLSTTFVGYWKYQDHIYDLDKLQFAYNVKPVKNAEVGIRAYWSGQGAIWVGWGTTGDDGSFTISTELIPSGATSVRAYPILFTWGPDRFSELLKVSDPVSLFSTWRSPRDTTIWFEPRSDSPLANVLAPGGLCDFGICWPETTTSVRHQPKSGAVNIYSTLYEARNFNSPAPDRELRVFWEPGYDSTTHYKWTPEHIFVNGDTAMISAGGSDEWDDDVILHEYGHFLNDYYAYIDQSKFDKIAPVHDWWTNDVIYTTTAYVEGWANYWSSRCRVGSGFDTLIINTLGGLSVLYDQSDYKNIENPWDYRGNSVYTFQPGPFCEGSLSGILWDIYDGFDEIPYPNDSLFADSLSLGTGYIWDIFDNYHAYDTCHSYSIGSFLRGWKNPPAHPAESYEHYDGMESILAHHGVDIPLRPKSLTSTCDSAYPWSSALSWKPGSSGGAKSAPSKSSAVGYNIYRYDSLVTHYYKINANLVTDTNYADNTVQENTTYFYRITAVDSADEESFYSNTSAVRIPHIQFLTKVPYATGYNNNAKLIYDPVNSNMHLIYQGPYVVSTSDYNLFYTNSTDAGHSWAVDTAIGCGRNPVIDLDTSGHPCVAWGGGAGPISFVRKTSPWLPIVLPQVCTISRVSMAIDHTDTAFVCYAGYNLPVNEETDEGEIQLVKFPVVNATVAVVETLALSGKTPMLAIDDSNNVHLVYVAAYEIYYLARIAGVWGTPINLSQSSLVAQHPMINVYGDKLSVTWEENNGGQYDIYNRILIISANTWTTAENISNNTSNSINPVTTMAGYAYWADDSSGTYQIYRKRYIDGAGWPDSTKQRITTDDSLCNYPQATFSQTIDTTKAFVIWTQNEAIPFKVRFDKSVVQPVAKIYIDGGQVLASPFNISRDGYKVFGPASYQSIDYGAEEVAYKFDNLNSNKDYKVSVTYYFENVESNAKGQSNKPIWHEQLKVDKQTVATTKVKAGQPTTVEVLVPRQWYAKDGSIVLTVKNINGKYAMATDVKLYEFSKPTSTEKTDGGTQTAFTAPVTLPLINQLCQNAPNPFGSQPTTIQYAVTKPGNVSLKVYNISGQLVKTLVNESKQPGYYNVSWNGKDEAGKQAASGVYFYRIQANGFDNTKKLVVLK